jgi:hypothetical protein
VYAVAEVNDTASEARSIRVCALEAVSSVREYTVFSAARQISAKSRVTAD